MRAQDDLFASAKVLLLQLENNLDALAAALDLGRRHGLVCVLNPAPVDLDATATVPFGTFHKCLRQEEFTPLEPEALEEKLYCPGFGIVDERDLSGGNVHTSLTNVIQR